MASEMELAGLIAGIGDDAGDEEVFAVAGSSVAPTARSSPWGLETGGYRRRPQKAGPLA